MSQKISPILFFQRILFKFGKPQITQYSLVDWSGVSVEEGGRTAYERALKRPSDTTHYLIENAEFSDFFFSNFSLFFLQPITHHYFSLENVSLPLRFICCLTTAWAGRLESEKKIKTFVSRLADSCKLFFNRRLAALRTPINPSLTIISVNMLPEIFGVRRMHNFRKQSRDAPLYGSASVKLTPGLTEKSKKYN